MPSELPAFHVRALRSDDPVRDFESREAEIQSYLHHQAWNGELANYSRTFLLVPDVEQAPLIWAYYTIAMSQVSVRDLPAEAITDGIRYPMPVGLLARVGRDRRLPREWEVGRLAIGHALRRLIDLSDQVGCAGITLDAKNPRLVSYYADLGFVSLPKSNLRMFMSIGRARRALGSE